MSHWIDGALPCSTESRIAADAQLDALSRWLLHRARRHAVRHPLARAFVEDVAQESLLRIAAIAGDAGLQTKRAVGPQAPPYELLASASTIVHNVVVDTERRERRCERLMERLASRWGGG